MSIKREHWGGTFGFVMASAGSAIGLGNVWKFPYVTGVNGGGAFVLIYLASILCVGLPVMLAEMAIGRAAQSDVIGSFKHFGKNSLLPRFIGGYGLGLATMLFFYGSYGVGCVVAIISLLFFKFGWGFAGFSASVVPLLILSYYAMIGGWFFIYTGKALSGDLRFANVEQAKEVFLDVAGNGSMTALFTLIFLLCCAVVCWFGVQKGLEMASKVMMPALFVLIVVLAVRGVTLEGATKGISFLLKPDFNKLTTHGVLEAMGHSFFTLSLGMGIVVTYGSYLSKKQSILKSALWVCILDTCISLLAGLAIFPAVFAVGMNPGAGPGLIFNILPVTFQAMPGNLSVLWNTLFFILMLLAALTSGMSLLEVGIASAMTQWHWSRKKSVLILTIIIMCLSVLSSFSNISWESLPLIKDFLVASFGTVKGSFMDQLDYICSNWMLPLNGLASAVFVGWIWGAGKAVRELYRQVPGEPMVALTKAERLKVVLSRQVPIRSWAFFVLFVSPILVLITFLFATGFFS
ncbi:MAG: sodium-dependent transporter [Lentisphaeria bacterium]|nr:sodium-dependent transporter [Lentisphaeria bacterium]